MQEDFNDEIIHSLCLGDHLWHFISTGLPEKEWILVDFHFTTGSPIVIKSAIRDTSSF